MRTALVSKLAGHNPSIRLHLDRGAHILPERNHPGITLATQRRNVDASLCFVHNFPQAGLDTPRLNHNFWDPHRRDSITLRRQLATALKPGGRGQGPSSPGAGPRWSMKGRPGNP